MAHSKPTDDIRNTAALYSLGALSPGEAREFEQHLAEGCDVCREEMRAFDSVTAALPLAVEEREPPRGLRDRLLTRIGAPQTNDPRPRMHVVRTTEGKWKPTPFPGVTVKTLHFDPKTSMMTNLLRIEAGASYPPHRHTAVEQCLVLEGDVSLDEVVLGPGDYSRNDAFSDHGRIRTRGGCLLLLISSHNDELLV